MDPRSRFVAAGGRRWTSDSQSSTQGSVRRERTGAASQLWTGGTTVRPLQQPLRPYTSLAADLAKF